MTLPGGTVTFLFTDIEGSTRLWEQHPEAMRAALARHDTLLRETFQSHNGHVFKTVGDAFCVAFAVASDALNAALQCQLRLLEEEWGPVGAVRVRIALHTGQAEQRDNDYFGPTLNRVARLLSIGYGQQTLLSQSTYSLVCDTLPVEVTLQDLGQHQLKDLLAHEHVWQLRHHALPTTFPPLKSLHSLPNNLPQQVTSFIGREKEMAQIKELLSNTRLLTLTGSGGTGKTRLAVQASAEVLEQYPDGVWLVELASLAEPSLVPRTVAEVLSIREVPGEPITNTLHSALKGRRLLLVLDNCEHLLDACARLANTLLRHCPHITILASSREALGIAGEQTYRVPSLSLPPQHVHATPQSLPQYEAARLFMDRALAVLPHFALTSANASPVAQVCVRLDGIPLAIELAAARVRSLSVEEINRRLDNRFRLLTGGSRTALPRQQTLRALIEWSYDLLNAQEKVLLHRLAVFNGGWTLEAAETVTTGKWEGSEESIEDWEVLDLLTSLVDKSLALAEAQAERTRFRLLETVRQYARERLVLSGESDAVRARHRDCFLALAEQAEPELTGAKQGLWLKRLDEEHENLRAGIEWSLLEIGAEGGLRFCGALSRFWWTCGYVSEGREWCVRALEAAGQERSPHRAKALNGAGILAHAQSDFTAARGYHEESLAIRTEIGDRGGIAMSLTNLGNVACSQGELASARTYYEESLAIRREIGDRWGIATSLNGLGNVASMQGDYASVQVYNEESLALRREIGDRRGIANSLHALGLVACSRGDYASARTYNEESLALRREIADRSGIAASLGNLGNIADEEGDYPSARVYLEESLAIKREIGDRSGIAYALEALAGLAGREGKAEQAAVLWGAAEALRAEIGSPVPPGEREAYDRCVAEVRKALGEAAFSAARAQGQAMTLEQVMDYAVGKLGK